MTQVGSNDRAFCGDGLEPHKNRRSRWVLLVIIEEDSIESNRGSQVNFELLAGLVFQKEGADIGSQRRYVLSYYIVRSA